MTILEETTQLVTDKMGGELDFVKIEKLVVGLFFTGVKLSNGTGGVWVKKPDELLDVLAAGGSGYHFFNDIAPRIVIEKE